MLAHVLTLVVSLGWLSQVCGLECIQCTSDPSAPNSNCIGNQNGTIASEVASVCGDGGGLAVLI